MEIIIVGNYRPDGQESMIRYEYLVTRILSNRGIKYQVACPAALIWRSWMQRFGEKSRWVKYIDKFVLFPIHLWWLSLNRPKAIFHIIDHGNSSYVCVLPESRCVVTCHDLFAAKAAIGDQSFKVVARPAGRLLQANIIKNLCRVRKIVAISEYTRGDIVCLGADPRKVVVIHNSLNAKFGEQAAARSFSNSGSVAAQPYGRYVLMVGSSHPRKNRICAIRAVLRFCKDSSIKLILAGEKMSDDERVLVDELGGNDRVMNVVKPEHHVLSDLYTNAIALLFPSYAEGFGWPIIEAQASGCPVVCSDRTCIPEVAGYGAIVCSADSPEDFGRAVDLLTQSISTRDELIAAGYRNLERFDLRLFEDRYFNIYQEINSGEGRH